MRHNETTINNSTGQIRIMLYSWYYRKASVSRPDNLVGVRVLVFKAIILTAVALLLTLFIAAFYQATGSPWNLAAHPTVVREPFERNGEVQTASHESLIADKKPWKMSDHLRVETILSYLVQTESKYIHGKKMNEPSWLICFSRFSANGKVFVRIVITVISFSD